MPRPKVCVIMRKIKNPWTDKPGYKCFGCSPNNEHGVKMTFYEDGDEVVCFWKPDECFQGWIDTMHGGIISVMLDEIGAWVVLRKQQTTCVTSKLELKFMKPMKTTDPQFTLRAHLVEMRRNLAVVDAHIENANGEICAQSHTVYFTFNKEKAAEMGFLGCELEGDEMLPM